VNGHHQDTMSRYYHLMGEHAELLNEFLLQDVQPGQVEMDELWTFIQKNRRTLEGITDQVWDRILIVSYSVVVWGSTEG
jgi:hypothetical protein